MSAKEKGGKEIVGDDERANDEETMMELHARRVFLFECCVASLSWRSHARSFLLLLSSCYRDVFSTKSCKYAPWKSIFSQKGGEDMDVVDEIRLKAFHSHGGVFIANEYRAIDRLYRSEEGCLRRDDCAADCAWWALKSSSLGLLCQPKFLFLLLKKNSRK